MNKWMKKLTALLCIAVLMCGISSLYILWEDNMVYWCFHIFATYHTLIFHSQREITERRPFTG